MGSKSSKHRSAAVEPLNRQLIEELCEDTGFSENELLVWHANFYRDCPDGRLTLRQFENEYAKVMGKPTQKTANYVRHMFGVYDHDKNQYIDFKEFVMALSAASVVNRLRLVETLFHMFDLDNDGKITKEEIGKMLHTLVDVTNSNEKRRSRNAPRDADQHEQKKKVDVQRRIDDAFNELNANDDDHITKDEFIEWYMKSGLISEVQSTDVTQNDPSRLPQMSKISRKLRKQNANVRFAEEQPDGNRHGTFQLVRHMSRMVERKSSSGPNDDDNRTTTNRRSYYDNDNNNYDDDDENGDEMDTRSAPTHSSLRTTTDGDQNSSAQRNEEDRWDHIFNSILGQIRAQRLKEQQQAEELTQINQTQPVTTERYGDSAKLWRRKVEENIQMGNFTQPSNGQIDRKSFPTSRNDRSLSNDSPPSSPDILSVRL